MGYPPEIAEVLKPDVERLVKAVQDIADEDFDMIGELAESNVPLVKSTNLLAEAVGVDGVVVKSDDDG